MDRTTLGHNILPLERDGLISVAPGRTDRRSRELQLTDAGIERLQAARSGWSEAQTHFAAAFGDVFPHRSPPPLGSSGAPLWLQAPKTR
jgi:DNA-binding MarR family transcriptional regulator